MNKLFIIIQREYLERVRKKSFLITTILMPVLMVVMMMAPALIMMFNNPETNKIGIVDRSESMAKQLHDTDLYEFIPLNQAPDSAVKNGVVNGYIVIPSDVYTSKNPQVKLLMNGAIPMEMESSIASQIKEIVESHKLHAYNIDNLQEILDEVETRVAVQEVRLDKDESESLSSSISFFIGIVMSFILYMFLLMYGQMVMTSIIEEKNNRVLEIVVSSVKPMQLMMGKIFGIGLVAITQIVIWAVVLAFAATLVLPSLLSADVMQQITAMRGGTLDVSTVQDMSMLTTLNVLTSVSYILTLFFWLTLFLVGGFLLYAAMFAAVGSAVDNIQDASQLQSFIIIPILIALIVSTSIGSAPNSPLALWLSMIPFTSPMVMMSRIPAGIEPWQPWVSVVILYASFVFMAWFAGKVYRIGIFMYGKKPNVKDLIRWAKYK